MQDINPRAPSLIFMKHLRQITLWCQTQEKDKTFNSKHPVLSLSLPSSRERESGRERKARVGDVDPNYHPLNSQTCPPRANVSHFRTFWRWKISSFINRTNKRRNLDPFLSSSLSTLEISFSIWIPLSPSYSLIFWGSSSWTLPIWILIVFDSEVFHLEMWRDPGAPVDSYYEVRPECDVPKTRFRIKVRST